MVDSGVKFAKKVCENVIMQLIIKQFCTFNLRALILNKINCHCKKSLILQPLCPCILWNRGRAVWTGGGQERRSPPIFWQIIYPISITGEAYAPPYYFSPPDFQTVPRPWEEEDSSKFRALLIFIIRLYSAKITFGAVHKRRRQFGKKGGRGGVWGNFNFIEIYWQIAVKNVNKGEGGVKKKPWHLLWMVPLKAI